MTEKLPFLVYKGQNSLDFGLLIADKGSYNGAQRDVTYISVAGRSGDLIIDNGRYKNINIPYKLNILNKTPYDFAEIACKIKGWLLAEQGYFPLWDIYDPDYFRYASYTNEVNIEQELKNVGSLTLGFNCKPMRYSFDGDRTITLKDYGILYNPELFVAKPYIKIYGHGNLELTLAHILGENVKDWEETHFVFEGVEEYIEIDSENMNVYKGNTPLNNKMRADCFPEIKPGKTRVSWAGDVDRLEIKPRWCCL